MAQSLAVKYRPKQFEDVLGQEMTVKILKRAIETNQLKNAYLLAGLSGAGKTTLARIFANEINGGTGNPIELDAASNGNVDNIRNIVENAKQRSLTSMYKIFIIDECHALSSTAWQAFLKSIEETPKYTIYIFCTTEPNKIPQTILNRVQRFNITEIPSAAIKNRLEYVCKAEGYYNYEETCDLISKLCNGCMRDAFMTLDQCASLGNDLSLANTKTVLGESRFERMIKLTRFLKEQNEAFVLMAIETLAKEGIDLKQFIDQYLDFIIEVTKYKLFGNINLTNIPLYLETTLIELIQLLDTTTWLNNLTNSLLNLKTIIKYDTSVKSTVSAYLLKICRGL